MPNTIKPLSRTFLTTASSTTLYTVPSATTTVITNIILTNTTASSIGTTLLFNDVSLLSGVAVSANSATTIDLKQALNASQTIKGGCGTASAINIHITGVEIS